MHGLVQFSQQIRPSEANLWYDTTSFPPQYHTFVEGVMSDVSPYHDEDGAEGGQRHENAGGIEDKSPLAFLIRLWRKQFFDSNQPKYMPRHWYTPFI